MGVNPAANPDAATPRRRRVGVMGGAFDPPHLAHRALAQTALTHLALDELRMLPTGQAWHKSRILSDARHRLAMVEQAFAGLEKWVIDPQETLRDGPSYTIDTLQALHHQHPDDLLFLIIGADQARVFQTWRCWREIVELAIICVADRDQSTRTHTLFGPKTMPEGRVVKLPMPLMPLSATAIRQHVAAGEAIDHLVGEPVARYIEHHHLYLAT